MTEIRLSFVLSPQHRVMAAKAEARRLGWRGWVLRWGLLLLVTPVAMIASFLISAGFVPGTEDFGRDLVLLGFYIGLLAVFVPVILFSLVQPMLLRSDPSEYGERHTRLSESGLVETMGPHESRMDWSGVLRVERVSRVTFLMIGEGRAFVLPDEGLPEGLEPKALLNRIEAWREAAVFGDERPG